MHIFDISNLADPQLVGEVELSARPQADSPGCGTHTLTLVPDPDENRVVIYNATSGGNALLPPGPDQACDWIDIVQVPLDNPGAASHVRREPLEGGHAAHDNGVILGDVNMLATASGHMSNVFNIGANDRGGTLEDPRFLLHDRGARRRNRGPMHGNWHSAAFTWDGEVIILGWEPGGGAAPECEATDPPVKKSAFFYDADTGAKLGQWTLPRPQSAAENCTIHNYNVVPLRSGKLRARQRQLPGGDVGHRLHRPGERGDGRLVRSAAARADAARRRLVFVLVQRLHLRVGDHEGPERLPAQRADDGRSDEARAPQPADAGNLRSTRNSDEPADEAAAARRPARRSTGRLL